MSSRKTRGNQRPKTCEEIEKKVNSKRKLTPETNQKKNQNQKKSKICRGTTTYPVASTSTASTSNSADGNSSKTKQFNSKIVELNEVQDSPTKEITSIDSLPEELLLSIFDYLGHGDLLTSRCVRKRWNQALTNWKKFTKKVVYLLKQKSFASFVLSQSEVLWNQLRLEKFRLNEKGFGNIEIPPAILNGVTTVDFSKSIVSWDGLHHNILKFPNLEELKITQCKMRRNALTKSTKLTKSYKKGTPLASSSSRQVTTRGGQQSQQNLSEALKNITSISLELRRISDMTFYLGQFNEVNLSGLTSLSLQEIYDGSEIITVEKAKSLLHTLLVLIQRSMTTLKVLRIKFVSLNVVNYFFAEIIDRLYTQKLESVMDLQVMDIWSFASEPTNHRDIEIFKKFIISQRNLQELRLPKVGFIVVPECVAVTRCIPKTVKKIHVASDKYMITDFLGNFSKLQDFACDFEIRPYILSDKSYPLMRSLEVQGTFTTVSISEIVKSFPNITRLNLNGSGNEDRPSMDDHHLQLVIKNLIHIKVLIIGVCRRISDFGITGIKQEYCEKLYRSRTLCLDSSIEVPPEYIIGRPISDLKGLTDLTISSATEISDVGIFYGFKFKELRSLSLRDNDYISDWGLDKLAKFNPCLHQMYLGCGKWVSRVGISRLKVRFRRMEMRNLIYVWPNTEYYSSDESYAMESADED